MFDGEKYWDFGDFDRLVFNEFNKVFDWIHGCIVVEL